MTIPNEAPRCAGRFVHDPYPREFAECTTCLRRTTPPGERWSYITPPELADGKCPSRIGEPS